MRGHACAIILAGGQGTRIRSLYPHVPKPLIPAAGAPFVEWVLRYLLGQGVLRGVVSLGHLAEVAEAYFARRAVRQGERFMTVREPEPLGTGGAVLFAADATGDADPLVVLNGDSLVLADLEPVWRMLEDPRVDGVLLGVEVEDAARYGTLASDGAGRLVGFHEKRAGSGCINAGVYFLRRRLLARFPLMTPLSLEKDVFPLLLARGALLRVAACRAPFLDIGTPETVVQAERFLREHFSESRLARPRRAA